MAEHQHGISGQGGSSYISGYEGCNSISKNSTETNLIHTGSIIHFSGKYFLFTNMEAAYNYMPKYSENGEMNGNPGDGYCRITKMLFE